MQVARKCARERVTSGQIFQTCRCQSFTGESPPQIHNPRSHNTIPEPFREAKHTIGQCGIRAFIPQRSGPPLLAFQDTAETSVRRAKSEKVLHHRALSKHSHPPFPSRCPPDRLYANSCLPSASVVSTIVNSRIHSPIRRSHGKAAVKGRSLCLLIKF